MHVVYTCFSSKENPILRKEKYTSTPPNYHVVVAKPLYNLSFICFAISVIYYLNLFRKWCYYLPTLQSATPISVANSRMAVMLAVMLDVLHL